MQKMQILEFYTSLILAYTTFVIPLCTFMISSFFSTVPLALEEAAEISLVSGLMSGSVKG